MPENSASLPDFTRWPSFPFEGDMRVKSLAAPVDIEPPRNGDDAADCVACTTPDDAYIWVSERWRVRAMDRPTGLPMVLILECRSHLDLGDLPNLLAAELGVMTVRLERAIRTLDKVARVHVNRWGDGSAHLHMWFLARPYGRLQLRGTFLSLWDDILPAIPEPEWRENLALVAAWLAEFGGRANAEPAHIQWQSPGTISDSTSTSTSAAASASTSASTSSSNSTSTSASASASASVTATMDLADDQGPAAEGAGGGSAAEASAAGQWRPTNLADVEGSKADEASADAALTDNGDVRADVMDRDGAGGDDLDDSGNGDTDPDDSSNRDASDQGRPGDASDQGRSGEVRPRRPEAEASARP